MTLRTRRRRGGIGFLGFDGFMAFDAVDMVRLSVRQFGFTFSIESLKRTTANIFRQDTFRKGYTVMANLHYNDDRPSVEYDKNGFLVRPTPVGDFRPNAIKVGYIGLNGDGHLGRLNLTNSYYFAFGNESHNPIAGRGVKGTFADGGNRSLD